MRLLFFYVPELTQCNAIMDLVPEWVEKINCNEHKDLAAKYNIVGVPIWIAVDEENNMVAGTNSINVDAVKQWFAALKEEK